MFIALASQLSYAQQKDNIYKKGWIDFNKNGTMDVYENPKAPLEKRVENLILQMNLNEKTCQMATLYGYKRVLKDSLPTPNWKNEIWKDGIANIDEQLNGVGLLTSNGRNAVVSKKPYLSFQQPRRSNQ